MPKPASGVPPVRPIMNARPRPKPIIATPTVRNRSPRFGPVPVAGGVVKPVAGLELPGIDFGRWRQPPLDHRHPLPVGQLSRHNHPDVEDPREPSHDEQRRYNHGAVEDAAWTGFQVRSASGARLLAGGNRLHEFEDVATRHDISSRNCRLAPNKWVFTVPRAEY